MKTIVRGVVTLLVLLNSAFVNGQQTDRERADALLKQMTIEEKLGQMNQLFFFGANAGDPFLNNIRNGQIGSLLFVTDPALINRLQRTAVTESRLKIR
jgi:beta-glucosidase